MSLILRDKAGEDADRLLWKPRGGEATATEDFGDPLVTTDYSFCVYDQAGGSSPVLFEAMAPAGGQCAGKPCWKPTGIKGFRYERKSRMPDGLGKLKLKAGEAGKASIAVLGRGENLSLPTLPLALPVLVQLQAQDRGCWEATYSAAGVVTNDPAQFKGRASSPGGAFLEP